MKVAGRGASFMRSTTLFLATFVLIVASGCGKAVDEGTAVEESTSGATGAAVVTDPNTGFDLDELGVDTAPPRLVNTRDIEENFPNGTPKIRTSVNVYSDSSEHYHGPFVEYHANGKIWKQGKCDDGMPVGEWKFFSENGTLVKTGEYTDDGLPDGPWTYTREDGKKYKVDQWKQGKKHGEWLVFDKTGQHVIQRIPYDNDRMHGTNVVWYEPTETGGALRKRLESQYVDGRRHGTFSDWYKNGKQRRLAEYRNGKQHGKFMEWDESGNVVAQLEFRDGERVKVPEKS